MDIIQDVTNIIIAAMDRMHQGGREKDKFQERGNLSHL